MAKSVLYTATDSDAGVRLDALLAERGCYASRSASAKRIEEGRVFVNGDVQPKRYAVKAGDTIVYEEEDEAAGQFSLRGEPIDLDIRYEDDDLLVISKQAGLICHPSFNHFDHTLVNALVYRYGHDHLAHVQGDDRPGIVHRLDGDTSGLMICAKDDAAGFALQEAIRVKEVDRRYLALVHGILAVDSGEVDAPIARNHKTGTTMLVSDAPGSREALTTFRVLERFEARKKDDGYTLVECKLFTGRTHQIRVHMHFIHHCIVGDPAYGSHGPAEQLGVQRQFLHSYRLAFDHPTTGVRLRFTDYLPDDLQTGLDCLSGRSMGTTPYGDEVLRALSEAKAVGGISSIGQA
ncbi:MAG: RluA family pseudouridine synthase [Eggerthellaceae bacterium]|jgi:23S rRNA pseudouridine1911/1915/1917 synthase